MTTDYIDNLDAVHVLKNKNELDPKFCKEIL